MTEPEAADVRAERVGQAAQPETRLFLEQNRQEFAELLTFIDFSEGLTIGFIEVNQEPNKALLIGALRTALADTDSCLEVMNFSREQDLRRLKDAIVQRLETVKTDRKLVLVVQGLEATIGTDGVGAYPPVLQDLNFIRDAYRQSVPHPLLFVLPDYAITRVSQYAPDFWAWSSGLFRFRTAVQTVEKLKAESFEQPSSQIASSDNQAQIDQLKGLLMEVNPSGQQIAPKDVLLCSEIYYKLGSAYLTQQRPEKARDYLLEGLKMLEAQSDAALRQSLRRKLGNAYKQTRQFEAAVSIYKIALAEARSLESSANVSSLLSDLGDVALAQRQFEQARDFYQQSLTLNEAHNDRYSQASIYHQLGMVAQELREYEQARSHYQQALDIFIEYNDRYTQATVYHQLGIVAQALREYEQARSHYQQALDIFIEYNDRYTQATVYHQLGIVAEELREYEQARSHYQQALDICIEYDDRYSQANTYGQLGLLAKAQEDYAQAQQHLIQALKIFIEFNDTHSTEIALGELSRIYKVTQDASLLTEIAQCLNTTVEEATQLFEQFSESA